MQDEKMAEALCSFYAKNLLNIPTPTPRESIPGGEEKIRAFFPDWLADGRLVGGGGKAVQVRRVDERLRVEL